MGYRSRKQLIIVAIIIIFFVLVGTGVYFAYFRHVATCFDGIQNQGETGVDCGGPCSFSCERLTIRDVQVNWVKYLNLQDNQYDLIAQIANPNPNYGVSDLKYTFKIYDSSGKEIKDQSGASFILPNQQKYLIEGGVNVGAPIGKIELAIEPTAQKDWAETSTDYQTPNIYVLNRQFSALDNPPGASQVSGTIKNDSPFDFDSIVVSIVLLDADKQIIGVNKTEANTVMAGEERYFNATWFTPIDKSRLDSIDIQADTNLLSDNNFMQKYGAPEKFQEY